MFWLVLRRELRLAWRQGNELVNPLWFFLIVITLFPLGIGPEPALLRRIAPGIIWVAALLVCLLSLERLFRDDAQDGTLEQLLLLPAPLASLLLSLDVATWRALALTLLLGTPTLSLLGVIGVALTLGARRGSVLLSLLLLPLFVPVLIFATAAVDNAASGLPVDGYLAVLGALLAGSVTLAPGATAAALRVGAP
ncbi:heme exporter protein CcmB [Candidatus Sodalis endolongispinus]|uniref:Heme exporter protein B n=1 Tax=Candidatus Sodalis endolongispinus TaxID=2812662 RepID=A0ABS5Y9G3_9GAMM|nr:heme exporter protein CcmB [Candidatus Sodalis endolongispinus]MBT9431608.1 heme exporter protein CcmB [Candidatus Sodalis endolongispinus]